MKLLITKEFGWDSAHCLRIGDEKESEAIFGKCKNLHGHFYKFFVTVSSAKYEDSSNHFKNGMIINFVELKKVVNELIVERFDHKYLNDDPLYRDGRLTTCENQIQDIWYILEDSLFDIGCQLEELKLYETPTSYATLRREE